jgi:alkylation response protein AidB-like acyl-CoA dehydrogenase
VGLRCARGHDPHPAEKWFRDAKVFQIVEGTSEIQRQIVVTYLKSGDGLGS